MSDWIDKAEREEMLKDYMKHLDVSHHFEALLDHAKAADERIAELEKSLERQAWCHAGCETIALGYSSSNDDVKMDEWSPAMKAVYDLRKSLNGTIAELKGDCHSYHIENERLINDNATLKEELADATHAIKSLSDALADANKGIDLQLGEIGRLDSDLTHADEVICDLEEMLSIRYRLMDEIIDTDEDVIAALRKEVERLKEDCETYYADEQKLRTENERMKASGDTLMEDRMMLKSLLTEAKEVLKMLHPPATGISGEDFVSLVIQKNALLAKIGEVL